MTRGPALVVKVGGSLFQEADHLVPVLAGSGRPLLLVPGGGPFARMVRSLDLPDDPAHWMAILAMDQYGWYLASGGVQVTHDLALPDGIEILLPSRVLRDRDPLPHSWDVTSDTIAAWVASELGLDLVLLKSVDGIGEDSHIIPLITGPIATAVVDPCLIPFVLSHGVRTTVLNGRHGERIRAFLAGKDVPRTVIEPRV